MPDKEGPQKKPNPPQPAKPDTVKKNPGKKDGDEDLNLDQLEEELQEDEIGDILDDLTEEDAETVVESHRQRSGE